MRASSGSVTGGSIMTEAVTGQDIRPALPFLGELCNPFNNALNFPADPCDGSEMSQNADSAFYQAPSPTSDLARRQGSALTGQIVRRG